MRMTKHLSTYLNRENKHLECHLQWHQWALTLE
jgi:hypothetical protein